MRWSPFTKCFAGLVACALAGAAWAQSAVVVEVDASTSSSRFRDLMGANKLPSFSSRTPGVNFDASNLYTAFGVSQVRLHDAGVDLCAIYTPATKLNLGVSPAQTVSGCELTSTGAVPHFSWTPASSADADLNNPDNYDFTAVDQALRAVLATGAVVYLRLGESYNGPNDTSDPVAWAKVATNIYKHVIGVFKPTAGLAVDPAFVEVFNEPDGGFWRGSASTFYTLYTETVTRVRAAASAAGRSVTIGGPGFTRSILTSSTVSGNPANGFIGAVGASNLDFYSFHLYNSCSTATLSSAATFLRGVRSLVDGQGGTGKPLHVTEWNIGLGSQCGNDLFAEARTQSFDSGVFTLMHDPSLDVRAAHYYAAVPIMALFDFTTVAGQVRINPSAWAFWAHAKLRSAPRYGVQVCQGSTCKAGHASETMPVVALAGKAGTGQTVILTNDGSSAQNVTLRVRGLASGAAVRATVLQPPATARDYPVSGAPQVISSSNLTQLLALVTQDASREATPTSSGQAEWSVSVPARSVQVIEVRPRSPSVVQQADCVFDWAEGRVPTLLAPAGATSTTVGEYYVRAYAGTSSYLGLRTSDSHLLYLDTRSGRGVLDLGTLATWAATSACQ